MKLLDDVANLGHVALEIRSGILHCRRIVYFYSKYSSSVGGAGVK